MSFPILKLCLVASNSFVICYLFIVTCDHFYSNYDLHSWGFAFHLLSLAWLSIRGLFWLATVMRIVHWTSESFYLLYWLPDPLEFAAFMLLPLYFTQILYPDWWKNKWGKYKPLYFSLIVVMIVCQILWTWLTDSPQEKRCTTTSDPSLKYKCFHTEDPSYIFRIVTGICFVCVALLQYNFGLKILDLDPRRYAQYFTTSKEVIAFVNNFLAISFASRSIYQFLAVIFTNMNLPNIPIEPGEGDVDFWVFLLFEWWVYAPTMIVVMTITSKTLSDRSIVDAGYSVIVRTYGAIDPSSSLTSIHPADLEESVEMQIVHGTSTKSFPQTAPMPIYAQTYSSQGEEAQLLNSFPSNQSSYNRMSSLSTSEVRRYVKPGSSHDSCNIEKGQSLSTYFHNLRLRSGSMNSESSSVDCVSKSHPDDIANSDREFRSQSRANSLGSGFGMSRGPSSRATSSRHKRPIRYYNEGGKRDGTDSTVDTRTEYAAARSCSFDRSHSNQIFMPTLSSEIVKESALERERTPSFGREMQLFHKQAQMEIQNELQDTASQSGQINSQIAESQHYEFEVEPVGQQVFSSGSYPSTQHLSEQPQAAGSLGSFYLPTTASHIQPLQNRDGFRSENLGSTYSDRLISSNPISGEEIAEEPMPPGFSYMYASSDSRSCNINEDGSVSPVLVSPYSNTTSASNCFNALHRSSMPSAILPQPSRPSVSTSRLLYANNISDTPPLGRSIPSNPALMSLLPPSPGVSTSQKSPGLLTPTYNQSVASSGQNDCRGIIFMDGSIPPRSNRAFDGAGESPMVPDFNSVLSYSPASMLFQRTQSQNSSLTPDRMEAARDATRLRQSLRDSSHNRSFTFSPNLTQNY